MMAHFLGLFGLTPLDGWAMLAGVPGLLFCYWMGGRK